MFFWTAGEANRLRWSRWKHCSMGAGLQRETLRNTSQTRIYRWWEYSFHGHLAVFMCALLFGLCSLKSWWPFPGARYQALLIPDCPGALNDLAHSGSLHRILTHFISHQSECEANFKSSQCVIYMSGVETCLLLCMQSLFVQWDKECRRCVVPPRDKAGSSAATA